MTANFSSRVLEEMGYLEPLGKGSLAASFMSVTVYEARGIVLSKGFSQAQKGRVAGASYRVSIAESVNEGSKSLIGDDFTESESDWLKEVKATGPFALVAVGPTDFIECDAGRLMRAPDGSIVTYDSFRSVRETLQSLEKRVLPPVVATLTSTLSETDHHVYLRKIDSGFSGRTHEGTIVHDNRITVSGEATVSRRIDDARAIEALNSAVERTPKLHPRAANYFSLAAADNDQLKKFLFFFLSLEVSTQATFGKIDHLRELHSQVFREGIAAPRSSTIGLINRDVASWSNLFDRFVWCAACVWTGLDEDDVKLFKALKSARDSIAHGRASEPPAGYARKAESLAHKVLWS